MRVLMISDVYFPRVNGVSTSIRTFRRELQRRGHEVDLVAPNYPESAAPSDAVIRIPSRGVPGDPEDRLMRWPTLRRVLDGARQDYDLIHVHTPFVAHYMGTRLARRRGIPCVETYHTYFEEYFHNYIRWLPRGMLARAARTLSRRQCDAVDALVVPSVQMRDILRDYRIATPMAVIPTGIDPVDFAAGDGERFRRRYGIGAGRPTLVHVGRLADEKNIGFLLEMLQALLRRLPEALLVLAGEGPAENALRRRAAELRLDASVLFVGNLDRNRELLDCYLAGDVFVFASRTETQGLVLLEAMSLGVPVVSTAVMGTASIVGAGRGAVAVPENPDFFAARVGALLADGAALSRLGEEARRFVVEEWSAMACTDRLLGLYAETLDSTRLAVTASPRFDRR